MIFGENWRKNGRFLWNMYFYSGWKMLICKKKLKYINKTIITHSVKRKLSFRMDELCDESVDLNIDIHCIVVIHQLVKQQ